MDKEIVPAKLGAASASRIAGAGQTQDSHAPSVPMRRAKRQVTDSDALKAIIDECKTVRLAAEDEHGLFIVPMSFGYKFETAGEAADEAVGETASAAVEEAVGVIAEEAEGGATDAAAGKVGGGAASVAAPKLTLWLHSAMEGRKARAFVDGAHVAIEMDLEDGVITGDYSCSYSYAYRSIMGQGRIRRVEDKAAKLKGLGLIMEHMAPGSCIEFTDQAVERVAVWRVDVEHFAGKQRAAKA